jgi:hypothetical protein
MGAVMAFIMLAFMLSMYASKAINAAIFVGSVVVFAGSLWLVRSQTTVGDLSYMRAMIPHHSIAIMTSNRSNLSDPRVQELASGIAEAQNKEIAEMRYLISDIAANGDAPVPAPASAPEIVSLDQALSTPVISRLDAEPMSEDEIALAFPNGPACTFAYTTESRPVLATDGDIALVKISADLVEVERKGDSFVGDGIQFAIGSDSDGDIFDSSGQAKEAEMRMQVGTTLNAGYIGWWTCGR